MYLAYIFLFVTVSAFPTGRVEVVFPSVETSRSGVKTVKFRAFDKDVELQLEPAGDILAEDFALYIGNHEKDHSFDVESVRRSLYRDSANGAALVIDDDEQPPSIEGFVLPNLSITPHEWKVIIEDGKRAHRVEKQTSDTNSYLSDKIILPDFQREMVNFTRIDRDDQCIVIEILSVTERIVTDYFERNTTLVRTISRLYLMAQNLYDSMDLGIKFRLSGAILFTKETEPPFFESNELKEDKLLNGDATLRDIKNYFCENPTSSTENADIIMLFLGRYMKILNADGSTGGLFTGVAYSGTVCHSCKKIGVISYVRSLFENFKAIAIEALAHETAHLLGVPHDGDPPEETGVSGSPGAKSCPFKDGFFMGRNKGVNRDIFSKCSKDCAKYLLSKPEASCVYEECKSPRY
uniref:Putative metalloproteinase n=1 Tax=Tityus obscurus TaxID=1221240 RepID=A0A1E1WVN7_TITOB